jgi:3-methylcrotonyl-CoA carboxylase beta subunit
VPKTDLALEKNKDQNKMLVSELQQKTAQIKLGGGKSKLEKNQISGENDCPRAGRLSIRQ